MSLAPELAHSGAVCVQEGTGAGGCRTRAQGRRLAMTGAARVGQEAPLDPVLLASDPCRGTASWSGTCT